MSLFYPIEWLLSSVFSLSYTLSGNYGIALIIMSVVITIITTPLYFLADIWKNKELALQKTMQPEIDSIKNNYSGQKQFYLTKTVHRIHNYKTWYPLRTSLGILIQIPFFMAAYNVLSNYPGYSGVSFGPIQDLNRPDGLLGSVNLLPILMTLINIVSSFLYTRSLKLKDNTQQIVLAVVFLLFLYESPSALLIYWTFNNVLSLLKNILVDLFTKNKKPFCFINIKDSFRQYKKAIWGIIQIILFYILIYLQNNLRPYMKYIALVLCVIQFVLFVKQFLLKKIFPSKSLITGYILYGALCVIYLLNFGFINSNTVLCLLLFFNCLLFYKVFYPAPAPILQSTKTRIVFILLSCTLFAIIIPTYIYFNNKIEFSIQYSQLFISLLISFSATTIVLIILSLFLFEKNDFVIIALLSSIVLFYFNQIFLPIDAGLMTEFSFQNDKTFISPEINLYLKDIVISLFVYYIITYLTNKKRTFILPFVSITVLLFAALTINYAYKNKDTIIMSTSNSGELPTKAESIHTFSRNGKNIIVILADMMNGNYFERCIEENPEYKKTLSGFTWYKDTLSIASDTLNSMPAIFGGEGFGPESLNKTDSSYGEEKDTALEKFFQPFIDEGFKTANIATTSLYQYKTTASNYFNQMTSDYSGYYLNKNGIKASEKNGKDYLLTMLPIYQFSPNVVKQYIYQDGYWNNPNLQISYRFNYGIQCASHLSLLPDISSVSDSYENSFIFAVNHITHDPWCINEDGEFFSSPTDLSIPKKEQAYLSSKKVVDLICNFVEWLKQNDIYKNTVIILVSDHGNQIQDNDLCGKTYDNISRPKTELDDDLSKAQPVLLIKDYGLDSEDFQISSAQMQNSDIYAYLQEKVLNRSDDFSSIFEYNDENPRERTYSQTLYHQNDYIDRTELPCVTYTVKGSMFNPDSWSDYE